MWTEYNCIDGAWNGQHMPCKLLAQTYLNAGGTQMRQRMERRINAQSGWMIGLEKGMQNNCTI